MKCHVLEQDGEDRLVADTRCNAAEKPAEDRHCVVEDTSHCDAKWNVEEWGQVSVLGEERRGVGGKNE